MIKFFVDTQGKEIGFALYRSDVNKIIPESAIDISEEKYRQALASPVNTFLNGEFSYVPPEQPELSEDEIRTQFKESREGAIRNLTIESNGWVFDADEISRSRMADTIVGLEPLETHLWVLADNSIVYPTREQLKQALRAIGTAQTNLWVQENVND